MKEKTEGDKPLPYNEYCYYILRLAPFARDDSILEVYLSLYPFIKDSGADYTAVTFEGGYCHIYFGEEVGAN